MRSTTGWRVNGPYKHGRKWRVQFSRGSGETRQTSYEVFDSRAAGEACVDGARDEASGLTVRRAVDRFLDERRAAGRAKVTVDTYEDRLLALLGPVLSRPLRSVRARGEELYRQVIAGRAPDTHQQALLVGRQWGRWAVKRRLLKADPFADVDPLGSRTLGADKPRLTVDESRKLEAWCLAQQLDPRAVVTLAYLYLGTRVSELVKRDVRDLDDDGRLLWIRRTKSVAGRRRLRLPDELGDLLLRLAGDRAPDAPLFAHPDGSRWTRQHARKLVRRACAAAGVPELSPQALRRTQATLATEAGETALAVAHHLGHAIGAAPKVTGRSYVGRDAAARARQGAALQLIHGGRR